MDLIGSRASDLALGRDLVVHFPTQIIELYTKGASTGPSTDTQRMTISSTRKTEVIGSHGRHDGDTGSPEVQIAVLTDRIRNLQDHFSGNKKDHSSRRGLLGMVSRRNRLLKYLAGTNRESYLKTIQTLGLRK